MTTTAPAASAWTRAGAGEYAPYDDRYVGKLPEGDVLALLEAQAAEAEAFLRGIPAEKHEHRYEPGKWSIKEVIGHVSDTEWVMAYRALRIGRGDATPLPGFEQDTFMAGEPFAGRTFGSLVDEWMDVRRATLSLFRGMPAEAADRVGTASENAVSVRGLASIIAGHAVHHLDIIRTRYLGQG